MLLILFLVDAVANNETWLAADVSHAVLCIHLQYKTTWMYFRMAFSMLEANFMQLQDV